MSKKLKSKEVKKDGHPCYGYHEFVPVDVLWLNLWGAMNGGIGGKKPKPPKVGWVVLACKCGAVKTVRAHLINKNVLLAEYLKA